MLSFWYLLSYEGYFQCSIYWYNNLFMIGYLRRKGLSGDFVKHIVLLRCLIVSTKNTIFMKNNIENLYLKYMINKNNKTSRI